MRTVARPCIGRDLETPYSPLWGVLIRDPRRDTCRDTSENLEINGLSENHRDPGSASLSANGASSSRYRLVSAIAFAGTTPDKGSVPREPNLSPLGKGFHEVSFFGGIARRCGTIGRQGGTDVLPARCFSSVQPLSESEW